jgi:hypothetical protein
MIRPSLCGYTFYKGIVFELVTQFPDSINGYSQEIFFIFERVLISWNPRLGRHVLIVSGAEVSFVPVSAGFYNTPDKKPVKSFSYSERFVYESYITSPAYSTSKAIAGGDVNENVPTDLFLCSGWSIRGTYTDNLLSTWWNAGAVPSNPIIGDTWTVTM